MTTDQVNPGARNVDGRVSGDVNADARTLPPFFRRLARIVNSGQTRSLLLAGEIHDLFPAEREDDGRGYVPLIDFLTDACAVPGLIILVCELNGPLRVIASDGRTAAAERLRKSWVGWRSGGSHDALVVEALTDRDRAAERERLERDFDRMTADIVGRPTLALEFLRQLTVCSRSHMPDGRPFLEENLLVLIEGADLILPAGRGDISSLGQADRHRIAIAQDWFSDPGFMDGPDSVVLLTPSASLIHPRVARLPAMISVDVDAPDNDARLRFITWFAGEHGSRAWDDDAQLARLTAGLSLHALRQLLIDATHAGDPLQPDAIIDKVEAFIETQLGEDTVEFKRPSHTLDDVVGATRLKEFIADELIPRFRSSGKDALPGAAVAGPIGSGKTFIFEALAADLDLPVLVLKNIRSQWFGQTDVLFEQLRRVLTALDKVLIFVDEADTQFGGIGGDAHPTERRLTGKIQQMMSDPQLRGKVIWLLMTARIHLLSPDIRRPGRVGDLIIPVLDPQPGSDDRTAFTRWAVSPLLKDPSDEDLERLAAAMSQPSAAGFAALRSNLKAHAIRHPDARGVDDVLSIVHDQLTPDIAATRRYQTLQALINCTRRSLLPDPDVTDEERGAWHREIHALEAMGIS